MSDGPVDTPRTRVAVVDPRPLVALLLVLGLATWAGLRWPIVGWSFVAGVTLLALRAFGFVLGARAAGSDPDADRGTSPPSPGSAPPATSPDRAD